MLRERIGMQRLREITSDAWKPLPRDHGRLSELESSYTYLRQFTPNVLAAIDFQGGSGTGELMEAVAVWDDQPFAGDFVTYQGVVQRPRPPQRSPIVIGGHSRAAMRRAVQHADGWYGVYLTPEEAAGALSDLRDAAKVYDRPGHLSELEITITPPPGPVDRETARRYAALGVHRLTIQPLDADMEATVTAGADLLGPP
ncbi:LLM class flavin-dependent oxidoreductase [Nonomuraea sp. NPDC049129]|uniref:LLM class flavin-dependent oxidoreductase n=1 Tax=Nonomuraea sp. NPDC049129 TaxID=3155272 RepID=UPI003400EE04